MPYKTVYYTPFNTECYSDRSFNPIIRQTELIDKTYAYTKCPVSVSYTHLRAHET